MRLAAAIVLLAGATLAQDEILPAEIGRWCYPGYCTETIAHDVLGRNRGTAFSTVALVSCGTGVQGYRFLSGASSIQFPLASIISVSNRTAKSVSLWVRFDSVPAFYGLYTDETEGDYVRFSLFRSVSTPGDGFEFATRNTITGNTGSRQILSSPGAPIAGQWYHVCASYDANKGLKALYINGVLVASSTAQLSAFTAAPSTRVKFGSYGGSYSIPGVITQVRMFDWGLSPELVRWIYANERGTLR